MVVLRSDAYKKSLDQEQVSHVNGIREETSKKLGSLPFCLLRRTLSSRHFEAQRSPHLITNATAAWILGFMDFTLWEINVLYKWPQASKPQKRNRIPHETSF